MNEYRYALERTSKKFKCPECGDKSFTKYIDIVTEKYLPDEYGKCDHANRCDYHKIHIQMVTRPEKEQRDRIWMDGKGLFPVGI